MRTIWKWPLALIGTRLVIPMPDQAELLCVQVQGGAPQLWALVDPEAPLVERAFWIFPTGGGVQTRTPNPKLRYISTYQQLSGALVWHVFEELP